MKVFTLFVASVFPAMALAAGSMRIDVEVYDGPLSKTLEVQKAELIGTINLTAHVLENITRAIQLSECRLGCFGTRSEFGSEHPNQMIKQCTAPGKSNSELKVLKSVNKSPATVKRLFSNIFPMKDHNWFSLMTTRRVDKSSDEPNEHLKFYFLQPNEYTTIPTKREDQPHQICPQLADVKLNVLSVLSYIYNTEASQIEQGEKDILHCKKTLLTSPRDPKSPGDLGVTEDCLTRIANVGKLLTEGAEHWATTQVAILPNSKRTRIAIARAAVTVAELGNEILARTDAIVRQQRGEAKAGLLPISMFLRESEGTDYLNLFEWLNATPRKSRQWPVQSRTRMIERLINDNNWSKINTAFAQGNGKTSMVFVKDDIGNWNLKNYDNDPSEMLDNYREIGTNLLNSAAELAKGVSSGEDVLNNLAGVQNSTKEAQNLLFGNASNASSNNLSENLESQIRVRITTTYQQYAELINAANKRKDTLKEQIIDVDKLLESKNKEFEEYSNQKQESSELIAVSQNKLRQKENELNDVRTLLDSEKPKTLPTLEKYNQISESIAQLKGEVSSQTEALKSFIASHSEKEKQLLELTDKKQGLTQEQQNNDATIERLPLEAVAVIEQILVLHQQNINAIKSSFLEAKS
ncbi:MAG: hypothetical protein CL579_10275 [Alteromonadaceae bacterium]|nr:hypothetical protein [Alteromonadaceae bacterium]MBB19346.1 hypothetical protein [Rickettsiales bacterium]